MSHISLLTLVIDDYDRAIDWFRRALNFDLLKDEPALTDDGAPKRWVVVAPKGGGCQILLAQADGPEQTARIGDQTGGRVGSSCTAMISPPTTPGCRSRACISRNPPAANLTARW